MSRSRNVLLGTVVGIDGDVLRIEASNPPDESLFDHRIGPKERLLPAEFERVGSRVVLGRYDSSAAWNAEPLFPDTEAGARAALAYVADSETQEHYASARWHPDPSVAGVWGVDVPAPSKDRLILYLAGHREPLGGLRRTTDFEEGERR